MSPNSNQSRRLRILSSPSPADYISSLRRQHGFVDSILASPNSPYVLHFLEHEPVLTLGRSFKEEHLLHGRDFYESRGMKVVAVERGGSVTWHGPGQLVIYIHVHLQELSLPIRDMLRDLEEWVISFLARRGIAGVRAPGMTGVWVDGAKVCAMGIAARKFVTFHGLSINLDPDLSWQQWIIPCGLNQPVTSVAKILGDSVDRASCERDMLECMPGWLMKLEREENQAEG